MSKKTKTIILILSAILVLVAGLILVLIFFKPKPEPAAVPAVSNKVDGTSKTKTDEPINTEGDLDYGGQDTSKERQDIVKLYGEIADIAQDIDYQNVKGEDMKLDLYKPKEKYLNELDKNGLPLVIYIHGGGWVGGDKTILDQVGGTVRLLKNGYAIASINYHLAPDYNYPTQLSDIEKAIVFLRANGQKYNLNTSKIGLMASSAGGHLAAQFASINPNQSAKVDCLVLVAPATDLYSDTWSHGMKQYIKKLMNGKSAADASPINNISLGIPPMFIAQGTQDHTVAPSQTQAYVDKLKANGLSPELLIVQDADHDFNNETPISPSKEEIGQQIVRFANKYLR